jgi:hypothetical protein
MPPYLTPLINYGALGLIVALLILAFIALWKFLVTTLREKNEENRELIHNFLSRTDAYNDTMKEFGQSANEQKHLLIEVRNLMHSNNINMMEIKMRLEKK